jgi:hypothetical protein
MATTNWDRADIFQNECPHTFNSLQHLVMSMAKVYNNRGKKSIFGKDKGLAAYKSFEEKLRDTVLAMVLDGVIQRNSPASDIRENLIEGIKLFASAFPNWQDAYQYADEYFVDDASVAEDRIRAIMR